MAKVVLTWIPKNEKWYTEKVIEDNISDEASVDDMFELWKRQMSFLGYGMDRFYLEEEEKNLTIKE